MQGSDTASIMSSQLGNPGINDQYNYGHYEHIRLLKPLMCRVTAFGTVLE